MSADSSSSASDAGTTLSARGMPEGKKTNPITLEQAMEEHVFGSTVKLQETSATFAPAIAKDFSSDEAANLADMQKAYGFTLTAKQKQFLQENKFFILPLASTTLAPKNDGDYDREFPALFRAVAGSLDYKARKPENAVFYSSDMFLHLYPVILTELVKEMENKEFAPAMLRISKQFYESASKQVGSAKGEDAQAAWMKVRNYFAVPYAILSNVRGAPTDEDYRTPDGNMRDPGEVMAQFKKEDANVDTDATAIAFVKSLKLDAESENRVIADIKSIYAATGKGQPAVFQEEYKEYAGITGIEFNVDYTQFTPRSHYTNTSLRRQYFRAMTWYIQLPFFVQSPALTDRAFKVAQLMSENNQALADYSRMESAINFIVGTSDDLMPVDYLAAVQSAKGKADSEAAMMDYLVKARPPKIKNISASYGAVGTENTSDVILKTKGMRFFSGKFILDSYWTQMLTQGDEKPHPGYPGKLPPMASSLQVMALLGSEYAKSKIPTLDFYKGSAGKAIDKAMADLAAENAKLTAADWQQNLYASSLWTISGLFDWLKANKAQLPKFMQSPLWDVKTLQTASGFWTEMRHATLLYAKQSFAEKGGGGGDCDTRKVPPAAVSYVEPNVRVYDRLLYLANRTKAGLTEQQFDLENIVALERYADALSMARDFSVKQLADTKLQEKVIQKTYTEGFDQPCTQNEIEGVSEVEKLRLLINDISAALPKPVEGTILPVKDKRTSLIADVHTGGDSSYPTQVLYQGIGVPRVIIVLVKDGNGSRATIGFTYSHYEFTQEYGGKRLTDEDWQKNFYEPSDDPYNAYQYTNASSWPSTPSWYDAILNVK